MRTFVVLSSALILTIYGNLVLAQDAYDTYLHNLYADQQLAPASPQNGGFYRWRPLEEESSKASPQLRQPRPAWGRGVTDYTDEPFGLPPGTYRPIEQRHTITPHLEGYRFRPIKPEEQRRNRARQETRGRIHDEQDLRQSNEREGLSDAYGAGGKRPAYNFRPDPRFDKSSRGAPSRYAFPMGSDAPRFRPR
jgi:hypothetical protein